MEDERIEAPVTEFAVRNGGLTALNECTAGEASRGASCHIREKEPNKSAEAFARKSSLRTVFEAI